MAYREVAGPPTHTVRNRARGEHRTMTIYEEIDIRRAQRQAKRMERKAREERIESIMGPIRYAAQVVLAFALVYGWLYAGCLWAAM